jgi:hypothetical protein
MRTSMIEKALLAAGVLGVAYFVLKPTATAAPANGGLLPPIPNPQPQPLPGPAPAPAPPNVLPVPPVTDPAALTAYVNQVLAQAAANPQSVNPAALDQAATELDQLNMPAQAAAVRAAAAAARAAQGGQPPVTGTGPGRPGRPRAMTLEDFALAASAPPAGVRLGTIGEGHFVRRF